MRTRHVTRNLINWLGNNQIHVTIFSAHIKTTLWIRSHWSLQNEENTMHCGDIMHAQ